VHAFLTIIFLINRYWLALLLNLPLLAYNAKKCVFAILLLNLSLPLSFSSFSLPPLSC
jgi:hypothetical protein